MKRLIILATLFLSVCLISAKKEAEFVKNWELKTMGGVDVKAKCTMRINPNGQFIGKGFCNNFTGNLMFDGKKKVKCNENIAMTKMFCKETQELENEFITKLKSVDSYEIDDDILYFKSNKQTVLTFSKIIEPKKTKKQKKEEAKQAEEKAKRDAKLAEEKAKRDAEQAKIDAENAKKAAKEAKKKK